LFLVFVFETAAVYKISPKIDFYFSYFKKLETQKFLEILEKTSVDEK